VWVSAVAVGLGEAAAVAGVWSCDGAGAAAADLLPGLPDDACAVAGGGVGAAG